MQLQMIGRIESCYKDKFGTPRQGALVPTSRGKIVFDSYIQPELALQGLESFSHLWVIFAFHANDNTKYHPKIHPPRLNGKTVGVFASRSPHRPNPIGLTLTKIEEVGADYVIISGLDLIEGTPVLDIKPYIAQADSVEDSKQGWLGTVETMDYKIVWDENLLQIVDKWSARIAQKGLKDCIEQTLKLDPRPVVYRQNDYKPHHFLRLFDGDIQFEYLPENVIKIMNIKFG